MKKAELIEESDSPYSSPTVCVLKPDGQLWVCINFWIVNRDNVNDAYPMHQIDEQLEAMTGSTIFTTLDLTKGDHQLVLRPDYKHITAFLSPDGLFQWKALPLGIKTTGAVFHKITENVMGDLQPRCVLVYINNITIDSPSLHHHVEDLDAVFSLLEATNLK